MAIDSERIAALIANLDDSDKPTVRAACDALTLLAANSPELCEILNRRLGEPGYKRYWPVAYILGNLPQPSRAAVGALLESLDHDEPDIRWAISLLLARIGKNNPELIDSLIRLCGAGSDNQKRMALYCLRDLMLSDAASLQAMLSSLDDREPTVRVAAAICLKARPDIDEAGKRVLLRAYTNDAASRVRHVAAITLASLGSPAAGFLTELKKNSEGEDERTKKAALAALEFLEKRRSAPISGASSR